MKAVYQRVRSEIATWRDRDEFIRPVTTLVSGTTAAYLLTYAARPVITRLFTAESFGLFTFFVAVLTIVSTISSGRYEDALMLPETENDALHLFVLAAGLVAGTAIITSLFIPWRNEIANLADQPGLAAWFILLPPAIVAVGWMQLAEIWFTRYNQFRIISSARFVRSGTTAGLQISAGLAGAGAGALIGGHVVGALVATTVLTTVIGYRYRNSLRENIRWARLRQQAVRYLRFLQYSTPAALLNNAIGRLPVVLLLVFFTADIVGYFGITYGTIAVPLGLVTGAIGQVFFVRAAEALPEKRLPRLTTRVHRRLVAIGIFPTAAAVVAGPKLFAFVFGTDWQMAGIYAQYLAPWIFLSSVASPLTRLFDVLERQRADLIFSAVMFMALTLTLVLGGTLGTALQTIAWFGIVGAVIRLSHVLLLLQITEVSWSIVPRQFGRYILLSTPFLGIVIAADHLSGPGLTFVLTLVAGAAYTGCMIADDITNFSEPHGGT
jgi:O-antigen/teichoic acid export membrane protein